MLPLDPAPRRTKSPAPAARLLLVDDSPEGRRGLARLLELSGFAVQSFPDGASAMEALRSGPVPEIVLTDLFLPDLDGREIARAAGRLEPRPFIGLVTGWNLAEEDGDLTAFGIDRVFLKPIDIRSLVESLREILGERGRG